MIVMALIKRGHSVLLPFGEGERYDFVVDHDGNLERVQAKSGQYIKGCVRFSTASHHKDGERREYKGQIDWFGVYCKAIDAVFMVPVSEAPGRMASLRIEKTASNQVVGVRWARDYAVEKF